ncbi:MAG: hypothetical protein ACLUFN_09875 [Eubacterium sp.]
MKFTKESVKRAFRTFLQAVIAYICVHVVLIDFSDQSESLRTVLIGLGVSALAAGLSAVMNLEKKEEISNDNG